MPATGRHGPHVVDVAVGEQHGDRLEPVFADDLGDAVGRILAGVDDHALGAGTRRHDVAVRGPGTRREAGNQHSLRLSSATVGRRAGIHHYPGAPVRAQTMKEHAVTSTEWGRVADDGTVFVKTADGERAVGQYPVGTPEEALKFYTDRFSALETEVSLLDQRVRSGGAQPRGSDRVDQDRARAAGRRQRGRRPGLLGGPARLARPGDRPAAVGAQGREGAEGGRVEGREGEAGRRGREDRGRHRLAPRRQPPPRDPRPLEGAAAHRPGFRRRALEAVLDRPHGVHATPQGALRRAGREARGRPGDQAAPGQGGRRPGHVHGLRADRRPLPRPDARVEGRRPRAQGHRRGAVEAVPRCPGHVLRRP